MSDVTGWRHANRILRCKNRTQPHTPGWQTDGQRTAGHHHQRGGTHLACWAADAHPPALNKQR